MGQGFPRAYCFPCLAVHVVQLVALECSGWEGQPLSLEPPESRAGVGCSLGCRQPPGRAREKLQVGRLKVVSRV